MHGNGRHAGPLRELEERVRAVGERVEEIFPQVVADLREILHADQALVYRLSEDPEQGIVLDFLHGAGFSSERTLREKTTRFLAGMHGQVALYDHRRPRAADRNRVRLPFRETAREDIERLPLMRLTHDIGLGGKEQARALICDGQSLLAWVGGFREEAFQEAEARAFAQVLPSIRQRLILERAMSAAALASRALVPALDAIGRAAFIVDRRGRVVHANDVGWAALEREGQELLALLRRCADRGDARFAHSELAGPGLPPHALLVEREAPATPAARLALAAARWRLTRRQVDVLGELVRGDANKAIAEALGCAVGTVELHVTAILAKAAVESRAELIAKFWCALR